MPEPLAWLSLPGKIGNISSSSVFTKAARRGISMIYFLEDLKCFNWVTDWLTIDMQRFLRDEDETPGVQDQQVYFFSTDKIALVGKIMAVCVAVTIVLIPVFLLFLTEMSRKTTSIMVLVFVLGFATLMSLLTGASVERVFAATCA
jgi:hypothetical protein